MIVVETIDSGSFKLNGVPYVTNFISEIVGDKVIIFNAYDNRFNKTELTKFDEYSVDGVVFGSAILLQEALIPILFTKPTGTGGTGGTGLTTQQAQELIDATAHVADNDLHITVEQKENFLNRTSRYTENEVIKASMGNSLRIYNGNFIELKDTATLPYTCPAIPLETDWIVDILSTFPAPSGTLIIPNSIQPSTTKILEVYDNFLTEKTTIDLGPNITINTNSYNYDLENDRFFVEVTSNSTISGYFPKINNGIEVELDTEFFISLGELITPGTAASPFCSVLLY
jgi:hypothetical protein